MVDTQGYNPYKFGFVGGSDSHNTGVPYRPEQLLRRPRRQRRPDRDPHERLISSAAWMFASENPAGLTGIWAEENTRESLWDAMQRRETFGTSGVRIQVRLFGGWDYGKEPARRCRLGRAKAYDGGTTMGSDLPAAPSGAKAPSFVVWAVKDPASGNLDRVQIVKGWTKHGQSFEKVHDVVWSGDREPAVGTGQVPPIASTVDLKTGTFTNENGATELSTVWTDPDFDPEPARLLLRARPRDPDAALDHGAGRQARRRHSRRGAGNGSGARLELADLVRADDRRNGWPRWGDGRRPRSERRPRPDRGRAEDADRRQGDLGPQQRHRRRAQAPLRQERHGRHPACRRQERRCCRASPATCRGRPTRTSARPTPSPTARS